MAQSRLSKAGLRPQDGCVHDTLSLYLRSSFARHMYVCHMRVAWCLAVSRVSRALVRSLVSSCVPPVSRMRLHERATSNRVRKVKYRDKQREYKITVNLKLNRATRDTQLPRAPDGRRRRRVADPRTRDAPRAPRRKSTNKIFSQKKSERTRQSFS